MFRVLVGASDPVVVQTSDEELLRGSQTYSAEGTGSVPPPLPDKYPLSDVVTVILLAGGRRNCES